MTVTIDGVEYLGDCWHCDRPVTKFKAHRVMVDDEDSVYHPDCCPGCGLCDLPWEH